MPLIYKDVSVIETQCVGFECNRCKATWNQDTFVGRMEMQEMLHWTNDCGYGSVWGDGARIEVTLCQSCTKELFKDFATRHENN